MAGRGELNMTIQSAMKGDRSNTLKEEKVDKVLQTLNKRPKAMEICGRRKLRHGDMVRMQNNNWSLCWRQREAERRAESVKGPNKRKPPWSNVLYSFFWQRCADRLQRTEISSRYRRRCIAKVRRMGFTLDRNKRKPPWDLWRR